MEQKGEGERGQGWRTFISDVGACRRPCLLCRQLLGQAVALHEGVLLVGHRLCCCVFCSVVARSTFT